MPKAEKIERVGELKERIEGSDALLLTDYRGLTVSDITELRRSLAEGGTRFAVVKNTLMQRAAVEASIDELESMLDGPTAVAFVDGDPVAAAKKVVDAAKKFPTLILKGGYMDGRVLSADEAKALADLESREVMLSKVAGLSEERDVPGRRGVRLGAVEVPVAARGVQREAPRRDAGRPRRPPRRPSLRRATSRGRDRDGGGHRRRARRTRRERRVRRGGVTHGEDEHG